MSRTVRNDTKVPRVDGLGRLKNHDGGAGDHVYRLPPALLRLSAGKDRLGTSEPKLLSAGNSEGNGTLETRLGCPALVLPSGRVVGPGASMGLVGILLERLVIGTGMDLAACIGPPVGVKEIGTALGVGRRCARVRGGLGVVGVLSGVVGVVDVVAIGVVVGAIGVGTLPNPSLLGAFRSGTPGLKDGMSIVGTLREVRVTRVKVVSEELSLVAGGIVGVIGAIGVVGVIGIVGIVGADGVVGVDPVLNDGVLEVIGRGVVDEVGVHDVGRHVVGVDVPLVRLVVG